MGMKNEKHGIYFECDNCCETTPFEPTLINMPSATKVPNQPNRHLQFPLKEGWTYGVEDDEVVTLCEDCAREYERIFTKNMSIKDFCNLDDDDECLTEEALEQLVSALKNMDKEFKALMQSDKTFKALMELEDMVQRGKHEHF